MSFDCRVSYHLYIYIYVCVCLCVCGWVGGWVGVCVLVINYKLLNNQ